MTILNYLHNKGYADAKVEIQLQDDPSSDKLIIAINASRGPLFSFGYTYFSGNALLTPDEINKQFSLRVETPFSPEKVRETTQAIKDWYGQRGYIDASVQSEIVLKENESVFDVHFIIDEGQQYRVGLVHIFGNSSTQNNVILRESLLVPGENSKLLDILKA
jgi:outer membrane protein insertion porin family